MIILTLFSTLLQIILYVLGIGALLALFFYWARTHYQQIHTSPEIFFTKTTDENYLALHRYQATSVLHNVPVIICHGLGSNRFQADLTEKGLAQSLCKQGYDVWIAELRGAGFSYCTSKKPIIFDEYVEQDLPAILSHILKKTKAEKVHWIGFSTGAMAAYVLAAKCNSFASLIGIGAPVHFSDQPNLRRFATVGWLLSFFGQVRLQMATTLFSPLGGRMNPRIIHAILNRNNIEGRTIRLALANAVSNLSRDALRQYADWVIHDQFRSIDHRIDYRKELSNIRCPLLLIAGKQDITAPPASMTKLLEQVGSKEKTLKIAGKEAGFSQDYGHADLAYGSRVSQEIFPWIYSWLSQKSSEEKAGENTSSVLSTEGEDLSP